MDFVILKPVAGRDRSFIFYTFVVTSPIHFTFTFINFHRSIMHLTILDCVFYDYEYKYGFT